MIKKFVSKPESFLLYRGERETNQGGLHFTTDKSWAERFGANLIEGTMPVDSKIKLITPEDMENAFHHGVLSEQLLWDSIFAQGYDAILGTDAMNSEVLDVVVNPKHLRRFTRKSLANEK